jgi:hypothetical protein
MSTTKLALFNEALTMLLGERKLASLSENREPRRVLDDVWDQGAVKYCLEQGQWNFAMRTSRLPYSPSVTPSFGYRRGFEKPSDLARVSKLCSDEFLNSPITAYTEEAGFWFSDYDDLYISYVSNHADYGSDMSLWPETFVRYVASYLAFRAVRRIKQSGTSADDIEKEMTKHLLDARSKDALAGPTQFLPAGRWTTARGTDALNYDRRPRGSLYG